MSGTKKAKVVFCGETSVGKTSIVQWAAHRGFTADRAATVGAVNVSITIQTGSSSVELSVWDTAGQERYRSLAPMYFSGAQVIILVFDITNPQTFKGLDEFVELLEQRAPSNCVMYLVGNKADMEDQRAITVDEATNYSLKSNCHRYVETSAKDGTGITDLFEDIATNEAVPFENDEYEYAVVSSTEMASATTSSKKCC